MMKTNCSWIEVYNIYNTLLPYEKLYLEKYSAYSQYTVFRWIVKRNEENAGFIKLYDMRRSDSHKGELIVAIAISGKYRGMGVRQELQEAAERFVLSSSKYNRLVWYANDDNLKSIYCAENLGYTKKTHEKDHWIFVKKLPNYPHDIDRAIVRFNNKLNDYEYGIVIGYKKYTSNAGISKNISKYTTIPPDIFELYECGTCWDYVEYEAKIFEEQFHFNFTIDHLEKDKEFSLYYMQIDDNKKCPTHTWLAYRDNGKIYLFESSWKSQMGITKYNTEEEMVNDYIKKHRKACNNKKDPIIVTRYKPNKTFGLTPKEFMRRCIYHGQIIHQDIKLYMPNLKVKYKL